MHFLQTLNSLVYPVSGGMEDWAYAGSAAIANRIVCHACMYMVYIAKQLHKIRDIHLQLQLHSATVDVHAENPL